MRANRLAVVDSTCDMQELASDNMQDLASNNNAAAPPDVQEVSPPQPPPLPPFQSGPLQRESNTVLLRNYKRAVISSTHCLFQQCRNRLLHLVPRFLKRILLQEHNFYVPRSCSV